MMNKVWTIVLLALPGCIRDAGECWVRGEEAGGVGGGVIVGAGAGGFGDVPPEPQNEPVSSDPCIQTVECEVTWKAGSGGCQSADPGPAATCRTYYRGQHRSLDEAKAACERAMGVGQNSNVESCGPCYWVQRSQGDIEKCQDKCDEKAAEGHKKCDAMEDGPGKAKCRQAVQEQWSNCYTDCRRNKG